MPLVKALVQQVEPAATIERMSPLAAKVSASVDEPRFATLVLAAFASLALALAATGLCGVLSFNIAQRRRELAVRAALGATRADLVTMVMREGLTMTIVGPRGRSGTRGGADADDVERTLRHHATRSRRVFGCAAAARDGRMRRVSDSARRALVIDPGEALKAE